MAAEKPDIKKEKKEKKDKKRSDESGVAKPKKDKKDKKEKKEKKDKLAAALDEKLQQDAAAQAATPAVKVADSDSDDSDMEEGADAVVVERTVVPFAIPLADDKGTKKVYKTIRKAAKNGTLKRGVKEVVKALRKSAPSAPGNTSFPGVVIIAGDISPMDVISHLPVLCEDHNVPFIFVSSRAELGAAAKTKRPTSVVMITEKPEGAAAKKQKLKKDDAKDGEDDGEAFAESYAALAKYVQKEYTKQAFWAKGGSKA